VSNGDLNWITNFIWCIADDVLRDLYVRGKYRDVILPMMVLRRLDAVLEPSKKAVLDMKASLDAAGVANPDMALRQAARQDFYNTSKFTLRDLKGRASNRPYGPTLRRILLDELHHLGLPTRAHDDTYFKMWESAGWIVAEADYSDGDQSDLTLCDTIIAVNGNAKPIVLRKVPCQKTDVDKPAVTEWTLIDLSDLEGGGTLDVILQADAYENHWLEVVSMDGGRARTIFSGLGYYL
jgi:HsdM N-terminal domain